MNSKPRIVTRITRKDAADDSDFPFKADDIRLVSQSEIISQYRKEAVRIFNEIPLPNTKEEAWRRSDLRMLKPARFKLPDVNGKDISSTPPEGLTFSTDHFAGSIHLSPTSSKVMLSPDLEKQGVIFTDLRTAEKDHSEQLEQVIGKVIKPDEGKFAALTAAFANNGVFLYVPKNVKIDTPLQSVFTTSEENSAFITHILIFVDEGASVTYFHEYTSNQPDQQKFHSGIIETILADHSTLKFVEIQAWDSSVWNFTHERVRVGDSANLDWVIGALGSHFTKSFIDLNLTGPGAVGKVSGFSFTNEKQLLDYDTQQNHLVPNTTSDLLYKVALTDESRSVWQGMIYVAPGADKTDGYQSNRNLVISPNARADSIPGLEILADDVRCTHGATIGDIDFEQVFYMMSRGIPRAEAEKLLVEGFFDPIMQRIPFENVRNRFQNSILRKLNL